MELNRSREVDDVCRNEDLAEYFLDGSAQQELEENGYTKDDIQWIKYATENGGFTDLEISWFMNAPEDLKNLEKTLNRLKEVVRKIIERASNCTNNDIPIDTPVAKLILEQNEGVQVDHLSNTILKNDPGSVDENLSSHQAARLIPRDKRRIKPSNPLFERAMRALSNW